MNVKIHYIFSKNYKIGSRLISWGSKHLSKYNKEIPSHGAILINDRWVIESTMETGVRVLSFSRWKEINTLCSKIQEPNEIPFDIIKQEYRNLEGCKYDKCGVLYSAIFVLLNKLFKVQIPKINKWQDSNKYFCLEVIGRITKTSYEMETPVQLMEELEEKLYGIRS